ncbi:MAG: hypothetical protein R2881_03120 [Eubacteriales bacterium]
MTSVTPEPTATPVPTPTPGLEVPTPTPRLYGRLSSLTLMEAIDELVSYGADITDVVEYDEAAAVLAVGKLIRTRSVDFTLNGSIDCVAETYDNIVAATARAQNTIRASANRSRRSLYLSA